MEENITNLYHYTSLDALLSILGTSNDEICLRATHAYYLNDPSEYYLAIKVLIESMKEYEMNEKIEECKSKFFNNRENPFYSMSHFYGEPYIFSLSENPDNLTMWRTYAKDGTGVAIGFDYDLLKNTRPIQI